MAVAKPAVPASADSVMRLSRAFMESRVLLTAAELDLFTELSRHPWTAAALAEARAWQPRPLAVVLDALVAMELLSKQDGVYRCEPAVGEQLSASSPTSVLASVQHAAALWGRWSTLTTRVAGGAPGPRPEDARAFCEAMHAIARPLAPRLVAAVRPAGTKHLLDLGGASGTYTLAFLEAVPGLHVTLFDRPEVIPLARERLTAGDCLDRVTLVPGDYLADPLPGGHDLAWLSAVIHSNGPEENLALYRRVFHALVPGGRIVIRDHVMNEDHTAPRAGALFAINMLSATSRGRTYSYREITGALAEANFTGVRLLQGGESMDALVEARKPASSGGQPRS
jgi:predicted O-methyltransferase YrrM